MMGVSMWPLIDGKKHNSELGHSQQQQRVRPRAPESMRLCPCCSATYNPHMHASRTVWAHTPTMATSCGAAVRCKS